MISTMWSNWKRPRSQAKLPALDSWWLDLKLGVRMLFKYPGLALAGGTGIAVGVAIAAGGFSVIYGNFLSSPLPFEEGDRIVSIEMWDTAASKPERRVLRDFQVWRQELRSVQEAGAFRNLTPNLIAPGSPPASVRVAAMSAAGFRMTGVRPLRGRHLEEEDERDGAAAVVVIGESMWRNRFGSDPAILGRIIQLGAISYSVVGVMPESFAFPVNHRIWIPLRNEGAAEPLTGQELRVFAKLAPGATFEAAKEELETVTRRGAQAYPQIYAHLRPQMLPYALPYFGFHDDKDMAGLMLMNSLTTALLVLVCLNVAILVYTRTALRQAEISIRTALGARRGRIVAQLFLEALVLSVLGAAAGVGVAAFVLRRIGDATAHIGSELPFWISFELSGAGVGYAALLSVLAAAIVGVAPALKATGGQVQNSLRVIGQGASGMRLGRTWTVLIVAQVGFAVALLPVSVSNAWADARDGLAGAGFAAREFVSAQIGMDDAADGRLYARRVDELMRGLQADPRVVDVTYASAIPGDDPGALIETVTASEAIEVRSAKVDVRYFHVFEVPVLAGRGFNAADLDSASAVIVNQSFAQRVFDGDALGKRIRNAARGGKPDGPWYEIAGIVSDFPTGVSPGMRDSALRVYHPVTAGGLRDISLAVRVRGSGGGADAAAAYSSQLRQMVASIDPDLQLRNVLGMEEALRREQWISRVQGAIFAGITFSVLLLSSAGIYALMSFTISQRRKEIGIRMALGASRSIIVRNIFSRAMGQLGTGAVLGAMGAFFLDKATGDVLMRGHGQVALSAVAVCMVAVGVAAAAGPARRGLRIQPTEALREQ